MGTEGEKPPPGKEKLVNSKERVRDLAEVYTPSNIVNEMLDLPGIKEACELPELQKGAGKYPVWPTFLEPACGHGNFLVAILERRLRAISEANPGARDQQLFEFKIILALSSVYGVDICITNVRRAHGRMVRTVGREFRAHCKRNSKDWKFSEEFKAALYGVLQGTVVLGNTLGGKETTEFVEFIPMRRGDEKTPAKNRSFSLEVKRRKFTFKETLDRAEEEARGEITGVRGGYRFPEADAVHYLKLAFAPTVGAL